jgi:hypothetical protein
MAVVRTKEYGVFGAGATVKWKSGELGPVLG